MDELAAIERYFQSRVRARSDVVTGIGDDAALLRVPPGDLLAVATDTLVEGTHFPPHAPADSLGHRSLAVNLSDLAAMGAEPLWCTLALSMPAATESFLEAFSRGFFALADRSGVQLVGGDTVRGPLAATVTAFGRVPAGEAVRRSGARVGDHVFVTGTPGDAAAGLRALMSAPDWPDEARGWLVRRFLYPEPRVIEGRAVRGLASAMIDLSDGLLVDVRRLAQASGCGAVLDVDLLPLSSQLRRCTGEEAATLAVVGGDDYELCFTVAPEHLSSLAALTRAWSVPATRIGVITAGDQVGWSRAGKPWKPPATSFQHF